MLGINLFGSRTLRWWRNFPHERKESWSLPDVTIYMKPIYWLLQTILQEMFKISTGLL